MALVKKILDLKQELIDSYRYFSNIENKEESVKIASNIIINTIERLNGFVQPLSPFQTVKEEKKFSVNIEPSFFLPEPEPVLERKELVLLEHQVDNAKRHFEILKRSIFTSDHSQMGSGKTYIAAWLINEMKFENVVIVCPAMLERIWYNMKEEYGLPIKHIVSYETLRGLGEDLNHPFLMKTITSKEIKHKKEIKIVKVSEYFPTQYLLNLIDKRTFFVFDEYHKIKNKTTNTYISVKALVEPLFIRPSQSKIIFMSGSPFDKKEQVISFLKLVHIIQNEKLYENMFGREVLEGFGYTEVKNYCMSINKNQTLALTNLSGKRISQTLLIDVIYNLYTNVMLNTISSSMPPPTIKTILDVKNGYYNVSEQRRPGLNNAINGLMTAVRYNPETGTIGNIGSDNIGAVTLALLDIEFNKIEIFIRKAKEILESNPYVKVVLVFNFTKSIFVCQDFLKEYNPLIMFGKTNKITRSKIIEQFNKPNTENRLLISNLVVTSLGINLHDINGRFPRYALISPNYRIIDSYQCVYRFYRTGTKSDATVRFVYAKNAELETSILNAYSRKSMVMKDTLVVQKLNGVVFPADYLKEEEEQKDVPYIYYQIKEGYITETVEPCASIEDVMAEYDIDIE